MPKPTVRGAAGPLALAMSEDELLVAVIDLAQRTGWRCHHTRNSKAGITQGDIGLPDLILVRPPQLIFAELKSERGRVTPGQRAWLDALRGCQGVAYDTRTLGSGE